MANVLGLASLRCHILEFIVEEFDRLGSFLTLAVCSSVDFFEEKMSSGLYQSAYPSQRVLEMRQLRPTEA